MTLIKCNECAKEISSEATACPSCGAPVKSVPAQTIRTFIKILLGIIGGLVVLSLGSRFISYLLFEDTSQSQSQIALTTSSQAPSSSSPQTPSREVFQISAVDLFNAYENNEVATDDKMREKIVEVSGYIEAIDKDFMDKVVIHLTTPNQFMSAGFSMLDSEKATAASLHKGEQVTIRCDRMTRIIGSPQGSDCTFYQPTPAPAGTNNSQTQNALSPPVSNESPDPLKYAGKLPLDVFKDSLVNPVFRSLLGKDYDHYSRNMDVSSLVQVVGDYYFGSACKAHACNTDMSAFAIHKSNGKVYAVMLDGTQIILFGGVQVNDLPPPLYSWVREHGGFNPPAPSEQAEQSVDQEENADPQPQGISKTAQSPQGASFNCKKAKSTAEVIICSDPELSKLDNELAGIYIQAKSKASDAQTFKKQATDAWQWREANCRDKACLVKWYVERKGALLKTN